MGELGVSISDPDAPSLDILNEILNSFGGRLFNEIRSKEVSNILILNEILNSFGGRLFNEIRSKEVSNISVHTCTTHEELLHFLLMH